MGVAAKVDSSRFNGRRRWPLHVGCRREKFTFAISCPYEFLLKLRLRIGSDVPITGTVVEVVGKLSLTIRW